VLHEVLHELHRSKARGLVLKIDFEKASSSMGFLRRDHERQRVSS
jgi:hypothetical protein